MEEEGREGGTTELEIKGIIYPQKTHWVVGRRKALQSEWAECSAAEER